MIDWEINFLEKIDLKLGKQVKILSKNRMEMFFSICEHISDVMQKNTQSISKEWKEETYYFVKRYDLYAGWAQTKRGMDLLSTGPAQKQL